MTTGTTDLHARLYAALCAVVPAERQRHHWVMSREWWQECADLAGWPDERQIEATMFGVPLRIRADGGFPHLVRGVVNTKRDAATLERAADILDARNTRNSFFGAVISKVLRQVAAKIKAEVEQP